MTQNNTVLITGATKGIGLELAKIFAANNFNLFLVARNETELETISKQLARDHSIKIDFLAKDLSKPEAAQELFDHLQKQNLFVEILINNAGFGNFGLFHKNNLKKEIEMLELNILSLTKLTHLFLQPMLAHRSGKILNVASIAAFLPGPLMANYYASKAYVLSFSEALANELKEFNIQVSVLCPGPTKTSFTKTAQMQDSKLFSKGAMEGKSVATYAYKQFMKGKNLIIPGLKNQLLRQLSRLVPLNLAAKFTRQAQENNKHS